MMNERIKQLAEQADNIEILPDEEFCDTDFLADIDPRRVKKFAELIVRECAKALDDKLANPNGASMAYCDGSDLLEHFGVEE